ncbi:MAG TPA: hypothetical protein VM925_00235 [Labilithrix sp.]|nr:hypothetical protein [Labilithrix sp.]
MAQAPGEVRNDRSDAVTKFCLAMEQHRRTEAGRVRTPREMLDFFFPRTPTSAEDRIFLHIPPVIRGPIVSAWGIRGSKSAVRDTDEKVRQVVFDALAAGDIDETSFEEGLDAQVVVDWAPLSDWWTFWRTGKLTGIAIQKALAVGRELGLFDDRWFLVNVDGRGGKLKGTDTLCDTLSKDQIVAWLRKVHESGDGSPAGLIQALGWETVLSKTSQEALLFALDALAKKIGLVGQAGATEMPMAGNENVALPEIPPFTAPNVDEAVLTEARGAMASSSGDEATAGIGPASERRQAPTQSGTMLSIDEAPISFRGVAEAASPRDDKAKGHVPMATPRKGVR